MHGFDLLTTIAAVVSIMSFLIVMWDRYPKWKKYIMPAGFFLAGVAIGRITFSFGPSIEPTPLELRSTFIIVALFLLLVAGLIVLHLMLKHGQPGLAYFVFFMILVLAVPKLISIYSETPSVVTPGDYLKLATIKEKEGDLDGAVRCLEQYCEHISEEEIRKQVKDKISNLRQKQIGDELLNR